MDKKNTTIGILLLVAAFVSFWLSAKYAPPPPPPVIPATTSGTPTAQNEAPPEGPARGVTEAVLAAAPASTAPAEFLSLSNDFITVNFTTAGGAIDTIELRKHAAVIGETAPYILNAKQAAPALALTSFPGADKDARYAVISQTASEITYRTIVDGKLEVTRSYRLQDGTKGDPYQVRHETTFRNLTEQSLPLPKLTVNAGTAVPLNQYDTGMYLNVGDYNGEKATFTRRDELAGGGFFTKSAPLPFIEKTVTAQRKNSAGAEVTSPALHWVSVKNQFFATILTPNTPATTVRIERVKLDSLAPAENLAAYGITAFAQTELPALAPGASTVWSAGLFAGPKEYSRLSTLAHFKQSEDLVMDFGFFGFFSKILLTIMTWIHGWLVNLTPSWAWGWAIVLTTLFLKTVFVPFTLAASRSSKRMAKIMPLINEVREKHKNNPAKAQEATMKVWKEHKVNPVGGCVPILITIPFFIGFFSMLQSAAELRFASFLWAHDLAAPDTIYSFGVVALPLLGLTHLNINILPLIMGATMIYQMKLTPTPSADPAQQTMMKVMPWIFTLFCYNFAAALALYSTVNGLFTIGQQMVINRMPDPDMPGLPAAKPGAIKNVTPKKK